MRLLDTWTGEFHWVNDPFREHYAILSHVWARTGEQSYEEIRTLQRDVKAALEVPPLSASPNDTVRTQAETKRWRRLSLSLRWRSGVKFYRPSTPEVHIDVRRPDTIFTHPAISDKIRNACERARRDGYRYLWIDSCCIDKSSSAELSEAINSMFHWYRWADVCYAHLADVDDDDDPRSQPSQFRSSQWHRRGWTLQELIAPDRVVFHSRNWKLLGSKVSLAQVIEQVTGIDRVVLEDPTTVFSVSVARRMWWASGRETTRVEDEAYSLMGIFGVHMSAIYGEGRNAFVRLQQEILRSIPDLSLFAWGGSITDTSSRRIAFAPGDSYGLLACSPADFAYSNPGASMQGYHDLLEMFGLAADTPPPECTITPYGIRARLLVIPNPTILVERHFFQTSFRPKCIAILGCRDDTYRFLTLPLCVSSTPFQSRSEHVVSFSPRGFVPARLWPVQGDYLAHHRHEIIPADLLIRTGGFHPGSQSVRPTPLLDDRTVSNEVLLRSWSQTHLHDMGYTVSQHTHLDRSDGGHATNLQMFVIRNSAVQVTIDVTVSEGTMRPTVRARYQTFSPVSAGPSYLREEPEDHAVEVSGSAYTHALAAPTVAFFSSRRITFTVYAPDGIPENTSRSAMTELGGSSSLTLTEIAHEWTITSCRFIDTDGCCKLGVEIDVSPTTVLRKVPKLYGDVGGEEREDMLHSSPSSSLTCLPGDMEQPQPFSASVRFANRQRVSRPLGPRGPRT